ncbi:hypothetical protein MPLSOD_280054 [Mesorhizobium sp. SOD10]|nr:hypothetical protein MPLSOD_280054 [Mesorhizobium sp. SOD10]
MGLHALDSDSQRKPHCAAPGSGIEKPAAAMSVGERPPAIGLNPAANTPEGPTAALTTHRRAKRSTDRSTIPTSRDSIVSETLSTS